MTRITEGAINVVSSPGGWYWHIPLSGDVWSVGFVTHKQHFAQSREKHDSLEEHYLHQLNAPKDMRWVLDGATFQGIANAARSAVRQTATIVDRVVATTDHGSEITLALSPPIERFRLRFAAAALPAGEQPGSLQTEYQGVVLETSPQPMPGQIRPDEPTVLQPIAPARGGRR